jgi:hypothetical protein
MAKAKILCQMSVDEIISEAIHREHVLMTFYKDAILEVGPDARLLMSHLYSQHSERIHQLEVLLAEIEDLRELTAPIAD